MAISTNNRASWNPCRSPPSLSLIYQIQWSSHTWRVVLSFLFRSSSHSVWHNFSSHILYLYVCYNFRLPPVLFLSWFPLSIHTSVLLSLFSYFFFFYFFVILFFILLQTIWCKSSFVFSQLSTSWSWYLLTKRRLVSLWMQTTSIYTYSLFFLMTFAVAFLWVGRAVFE